MTWLAALALILSLLPAAWRVHTARTVAVVPIKTITKYEAWNRIHGRVHSISAAGNCAASSRVSTRARVSARRCRT